LILNSALSVAQLLAGINGNNPVLLRGRNCFKNWFHNATNLDADEMVNFPQHNFAF
jgi:hypothetical protein